MCFAGIALGVVVLCIRGLAHTELFMAVAIFRDAVTPNRLRSKMKAYKHNSTIIGAIFM